MVSCVKQDCILALILCRLTSYSYFRPDTIVKLGWKISIHYTFIWSNWFDVDVAPLRTSLVAQMVKNLPAMQETWGLIPDLGRSLGEGNGNPLQYFCLENPMDYTVHGILQARIVEWIAVPFSRGSSQPRDRTPGLLHCRWILYPLSYKESPRVY